MPGVVTVNLPALDGAEEDSADESDEIEEAAEVHKSHERLKASSVDGSGLEEVIDAAESSDGSLFATSFAETRTMAWLRDSKETVHRLSMIYDYSSKLQAMLYAVLLCVHTNAQS